MTGGRICGLPFRARRRTANQASCSNSLQPHLPPSFTCKGRDTGIIHKVGYKRCLLIKFKTKHTFFQSNAGPHFEFTRPSLKGSFFLDLKIRSKARQVGFVIPV